MGRKILTLALCLLASIVIVAFLPVFFHAFSFVEVSGADAEKTGIFDQKAESISARPEKIHKLYVNGKLIGVLHDEKALQNHLKEVYQKRYEKDYPGTHADLGEDVYLSDEESYCTYTDKDDEIFAYLDQNDLYTLEATRVSFSKDGKMEAQIYVMDQKTYQKAMNDYISLFIDPDALARLNRGEDIPDLTAYGSQDVGVSIDQTITIDKADASPQDILKNRKQILDYLEYGSHPKKEYYTVRKYDTVAGVGAKNYGLSAVQVMNINRDKIKSTDQVLTEGEKLCVTYFESPIDITVYRQSLKEETVYYDTAYSDDNTLMKGQSEIRQKGSNGTRNALYTEKWINGVLVSGKLESSVETKQPVNEVVAVGTHEIPSVGTGQFRYPVDNAAISCPWGCYYGHRGTDFIDVYNSWGDVYAADNGVVITNDYNDVNGNYVEIDHNNGWVSYYGHMREPSDLPVGTVVQKGQVIGHIGMTGAATGPHTHFFLTYKGERKNACEVDIFPSCDGLVQ